MGQASSLPDNPNRLHDEIVARLRHFEDVTGMQVDRIDVQHVRHPSSGKKPISAIVMYFSHAQPYDQEAP